MRKFALLLFVIAPLAAAQDFATSFKSTVVTDGIYMLDGEDGFGGGNVGLLTGKEYVVLIDDAEKAILVSPSPRCPACA